ncbi:hypothetical protein AB835_12705 [Candidatus Endobugula sertula]|uniref:Cadherin domain-containing protein n=1 Tax=Candidatus Endobugula sertula TaxID=62101 RepID=A0A1D2QMC6_9GAMM|nr:hypothetical protein AB835_12705 [Candidatus Endobugula sertula]
MDKLTYLVNKTWEQTLHVRDRGSANVLTDKTVSLSQAAKNLGFSITGDPGGSSFTLKFTGDLSLLSNNGYDLKIQVGGYSDSLAVTVKSNIAPMFLILVASRYAIDPNTLQTGMKVAHVWATDVDNEGRLTYAFYGDHTDFSIDLDGKITYTGQPEAFPDSKTLTVTVTDGVAVDSKQVIITKKHPVSGAGGDDGEDRPPKERFH